MGMALRIIKLAETHYKSFLSFQVSSQQAWASLSTCLIVLEKPVFNRWLQSADMAGRGIYSIPVLLDALETAISTAPPLPTHKYLFKIIFH